MPETAKSEEYLKKKPWSSCQAVGLRRAVVEMGQFPAAARHLQKIILHVRLSHRLKELGCQPCCFRVAAGFRMDFMARRDKGLGCCWE